MKVTFYLKQKVKYCLDKVFDLPGSLAGKESTCNAGNPGSIPGSERSSGEGSIYLLQYSWASLVAQLVKSWPAVWQTWAWFLGREDPLEKGMATCSSILAWRIPRTWLNDSHFYFFVCYSLQDFPGPLYTNVNYWSPSGQTLSGISQAWLTTRPHFQNVYHVRVFWN